MSSKRGGKRGKRRFESTGTAVLEPAEAPSAAPSGSSHPAHAPKPPAKSLPKPERVPDNLWRRGLYWLVCTALLVIPFYFAPANINPYNKTFYLLVLFAAVAAIGLWWAVSKKAIALVYTPFFAAVGVWLLAKLVTTATSMLPAKSFWGSYGTWSDGFLWAFCAASIAAVIITLRLETGRVARLLQLLMAQAVVMAGVTLYQAVHQGFFHQKVRPDSLLLNADFYISYAVLFWPLFVILLIWHARRRRWLWTVAYALGTLILSASLFVTLPTHLQTILAPAFLNGKKDTTYGKTDSQDISANNFTQDNANLERWTEWQIGVDVGMKRPLVGTGPSTTAQAFFQNKSHLNLKGWDHTHVMQRSHSDLIEQFSQEGVLGLLAYLALWVVLIWIVAKRFRQVEPSARPYALGLAAGLLLWFGFNQLLFTTVVVGMLAWVWIALLLTLVHSARPVKGFWPQAVAVTTALALSAGGYWMVHYYVDDVYVLNALWVNQHLANGDYKDISSDQRVAVRVAAEQQLNMAADDIPAEDYYARNAAFAAIDTYIAVKFPNPADNQNHSANALKYAKLALADDPWSPDHLQNLGGIEYYLAAPGSAQEKQGIALIDRAIDLTPKSVAWYHGAARIAALKHDYPLAWSYIHRGLAAAPTPADHKYLEELAHTLPPAGSGTGS